MFTELITPVYAAIIALMFVLLSVRTLRLRRRFSVAIGGGNEPLLERATRAHANFAEYVPIALLLIFFLEIQGGSTLRIHIACGVLLIGRIIHAWGISQPREDFRFRVLGMAMTFTALIGTAVALLALNL